MADIVPAYPATWRVSCATNSLTPWFREHRRWACTPWKAQVTPASNTTRYTAVGYAFDIPSVRDMVVKFYLHCQQPHFRKTRNPPPPFSTKPLSASTARLPRNIPLFLVPTPPTTVTPCYLPSACTLQNSVSVAERHVANLLRRQHLHNATRRLNGFLQPRAPYRRQAVTSGLGNDTTRLCSMGLPWRGQQDILSGRWWATTRTRSGDDCLTAATKPALYPAHTVPPSPVKPLYLP